MLLTGVAAVNVALDDVALAQQAMVASVLAVALGFALRLAGVKREYLFYIGFAIVALAVVFPGFRSGMTGLLMPASPFMEAESGIATVMLWLAVVSAAGATTNASTTFVAVPLTTAFAMVAQSNIGDQFFALLMVFALLGLFQVSYEHLLNQTARGQEERPASVPPGQALHVALLFASLFCSVAFVAASVGARSATLVSQGALRRALQNVAVGAGRMPPPAAPAIYYRQGQGLTLGEPLVPPSDNPMMSVEASAPSLWRGAAYDQYTGTGWRASLTGVSTARAAGEWSQVPQRPEEIPNTYRVLRQRVRIAQLRTNALFAAPVPVRVRGEFRLVRTSAYGNISVAGTTYTGLTYEVDSLSPAHTEAALRQAGQDYPEWIKALYLQLPNSAWPIREVAARAARGRDGPFDQVVALQRYLEREFTYTLNPPRAPEGADCTVWFLTVSRRGYCDLFASALALMTRSQGIPARVVTGFSTGVEEEPGTYLLRARDAHAWAEVHFPGWGWIAFDPEPVRAAEGRAGAARRASFALGRWLRVHVRLTRPRLVLLVTFLLALVLLFQRSLQAAAEEAARRLFGPSLSPAERVWRAYAAAERALLKAGLRRLPHETVREHLSKVEGARERLGEEVAAALSQMTQLVEEACYSRRTAGPTQASRAQWALERLKRAVRRPPRRASSGAH